MLAKSFVQVSYRFGGCNISIVWIQFFHPQLLGRYFCVLFSSIYIPTSNTIQSIEPNRRMASTINCNYVSVTCTATPMNQQDSNTPILPTKIILPNKKPQKWSTGVAPGEYGGPPTTTKLRKYWGGEKEDPITSDELIWNRDFMPHMKRLIGDNDDASFPDPTLSSDKVLFF